MVESVRSIAECRKAYPGAYEGDPLYIFDLDGTLSLTHKRQHLLARPRSSASWDAFYQACDTDEPNIPVIKIADNLLRTGYDVWIFSGRRSEVREKTVEWLRKHTAFSPADLEFTLRMRDIGDNTEDAILKKMWFEQMLEYDRARVHAIFDDRNRVVRMWRGIGIPCFQVAEGDF